MFEAIREGRLTHEGGILERIAALSGKCAELM